MHTSCKQFPHLRGLSDAEIRNRVSAALAARSGLVWIYRISGFLVIFAILATGYLIFRSLHVPGNVLSNGQLGYIMMVSGGIGFSLALVRRLLWINLVLYPLTDRKT